MNRLRRLAIPLAVLALLVSEAAQSEGPNQKIPDGILVKGIAFSTDELRALHAKELGLRREIARNDENRAITRVREVIAAAPYNLVDPWPKEANAFVGIREAVLDGIHARLDSPSGPVDDSYLAVLREYVASTPLGWRWGIWDQAVLNWAAGFAQMHGDQAIALAAARANDASLPPVDRALHLAVFRITPGRDWGHPQRELALETYRPYLHPSVPPIMQEMAVMATDGLWDFEAVKNLERLAFTSPSFHARSSANWLISELYIRGPRRTHSLRGRNRPPYDYSAASAWSDRGEDFWREFDRLIGMEDVAEAERAQREAEQAQASQRPAVPMMPAGSGAGSLPNDGMPHRLPPAAQ